MEKIGNLGREKGEERAFFGASYSSDYPASRSQMWVPGVAVEREGSSLKNQDVSFPPALLVPRWGATKTSVCRSPHLPSRRGAGLWSEADPGWKTGFLTSHSRDRPRLSELAFPRLRNGDDNSAALVGMVRKITRPKAWCVLGTQGPLGVIPRLLPSLLLGDDAKHQQRAWPWRVQT